MSYLPLILIIVTVAIVAFVIERRWQAGKTAETPESGAKMDSDLKSSPKTDTSLGSKISGGFNNLRDKVIRKKPNLSEQFQVWAEENLVKEKGLKNWLNTLSQEESKTFVKQLASFCADRNLKLSWLFEQQLDKDPEIEQAIKNVVVSYCMACWQAAQTKNDFIVFDTFLMISQKPSSKEHRVLQQKLFTELVKQELTPAISPELFLDSDKERHKHVRQAIYQAAEADRPKFNNVLKQVLASEAVEEESLSSKILKRVKISKPSEEEQPAAVISVEEQPAVST